jgi:hypothetical protein
VANLGGNDVAFSAKPVSNLLAKLEDIVLKSTSASEIQQNEKQQEILTEIKGDEEPLSFEAA